MNEPNRPKPQPPQPEECCNSGCYPCVWDYYQMALDDWNKDQKAKLPAQNEDSDSQPPHKK